MFSEVTKPRVGHRCYTCNILSELKGDDRVALEEWLGDPSKSASMIRAGLEAYGYKISTTALSRHRRECR